MIVKQNLSLIEFPFLDTDVCEDPSDGSREV